MKKKNQIMPDFFCSIYFTQKICINKIFLLIYSPVINTCVDLLDCAISLA